MYEKWYQLLLKKINKSYHARIIVNDPDRLGQAQEVRAALENTFALHDYDGELSLRRFLMANAGKRILIFKTSDVTYIPYDIEAGSEIIPWHLKEIFPRLNLSVIKTVPVEQYQTIYAAYKAMEYLLGTAGEEETRQMVTKWLAPRVCSEKSSGFAITPSDSNDDPLEYCSMLMQRIEELLKQENVDWRALAPVWGELAYRQCLDSVELPEIAALDQRISRRFEKYTINSYDGLFYDGFTTRPATIDRVLHYLAYLPLSKKVLLCMDGMGFQEWLCIREYLAERGVHNFKEMAVFALVPTLTGISRRALFCGRSKDKSRIEENKGFLQFVQQNWPEGHLHSVGMFMHVDGRWHTEYMDYDYIGLIYNLVDDVAHSMIYVKENKRLMQKILIEHLHESGLADLVRGFLNEDYRVYITADHGTLWCRGNGYQASKWLVEEKAKRVLMYPNKLLAEEFTRDKNDLYIYQNSKLFGDSVAVFPSGRSMFGNKNDTAISHGGIHLEEVIVPFVEVLA